MTGRQTRGRVELRRGKVGGGGVTEEGQLFTKAGSKTLQITVGANVLLVRGCIISVVAA